MHVRPAAQNIDPLICMLLQMLREMPDLISEQREAVGIISPPGLSLRGGEGEVCRCYFNMIIIAMRGEGDVRSD